MKIITRTILATAVTFSLAASACNKTEQEQPSSETAEPAGKMDQEKANLKPSDDKVGVPECDEYITKYTACINDKMPEAAREQTRQAMQQTVDAWKQTAAQGAEVKAALAAGCKSALDAAKTATQAWGCSW